ncbi:hypothetical protein GGI25_006263 [Coemansia spiralis]|uniref:Vacuolar protein sorting-associated protein 54 n=2 Tax=Coemansia TaxID=4863 RepID=A0A9W8G334_9FUNG|nr:hypothetical protein EDC05_000865 [Coemansia umbellata]KAJ2625042.1 hypothetical protein GGI26_000845 [Coemansia sp. RSA 1358]KAJ2669088.1 hypothetical protein GGI25_006263 [Coemansia spiralis]
MKRQSGIGIIRQGGDVRNAGGSSYFQRRVQPSSAAAAQPGQQYIRPRSSGDLAMLADTQAPSSVSRTESASPSKEKPNLNVQYGLNAIAVLTNQPNKAPARIHRSDLPTVPRTHYPKIKTSDFDEYLQSISTLFEQYSSNMRSGYPIATDDLDRYEAAVEDAEKVLEEASHTYSMDSTTMAERLKALDLARSEFGLDSVSEYGGKDAAGTASDVLGKGGAESQAADAVTGNSLGVTNQLPGIEDVPTIFFEENFDLRDPAVFDIATQVVLGPHNATAGLFSPEKSAETSATMQETLSAYMDVVEAYLTREISRRSPSFFAALSMLKELHAETDNCIEKIHVLRDDLKGTAQSQCLPGLELIRLRRRRDNLSTVLSNIQLLGNLRHIQPTVDELIGSGDYIGALNLITEAQEMIEPVKCQAQQGTSDFGLVGTKAFRHLSSRMDKSLKSVSLHAEQELATIIMRDMREFVEDGLSNSDDGLLSMSQVDIYQANLSMQLTPFICGLVRTGGIGSALKAYGDSIMSETAVLIESLYPNGFPRSQGHASFNDASQQRALGTAVRNQTFDQFRALIKQQQALLLLIIGHISMVRRAILAVLEENWPTDATEYGDRVHKQSTCLVDATTQDLPSLSERNPQLAPTRGTPSSIRTIDMEGISTANSNSYSQLPLSKRYGSAQTEVIRSLNDTFDAFMDVAHVRCAKLLNHRSEQNARLSLTGFYSLYTSIWQFIVQYEQLGSKMCFGLRGTLTAQAKAFLNNFHIEKSRQIQILIENEQWVQAEVPIDFQNLVNQVVNAAYASTEATNDDQGALALEGGNDISTHGSMSTLASGFGMPFANSPLSLGNLNADNSSASSKSLFALSQAPSSQQQPNSPVVTKHADSFSSISNVQMLSRQDSDAASIRSADTAGIGLMHIGGESFHVVGCSLVLVKSVVEYLQCAVNIPMLVTDVLQRLVEVFKSFNSRTCQVVLGAGAMRSAGLKNISAKHIALASESLALCMELIPYVKECLRHVMSSSQAVLLSQLDRTVNDFVNHQHELHRKLVTIMTDRADYHARMLSATKWDELDSAVQPPVPAMDALIKEVRKLHKVLKKYLPQSILRSVFAQIFTMYEAKLAAQYRKFCITSSEGKRQLMLNSQYLLRRLRALDSALSVDWELEVVVNNIDLVKPYQPTGSSTSKHTSASKADDPVYVASSEPVSAAIITSPPTENSSSKTPEADSDSSGAAIHEYQSPASA